MCESLNVTSQRCTGQVIYLQHLTGCRSNSLLLPISKIHVGRYALSFTWTEVAGVINDCSFFTGDATASALTAVFMANVVLVAYIYISVQEENKARVATTATTDETKKTQ